MKNVKITHTPMYLSFLFMITVLLFIFSLSHAKDSQGKNQNPVDKPSEKMSQNKDNKSLKEMSQDQIDTLQEKTSQTQKKAPSHLKEGSKTPSLNTEMTNPSQKTKKDSNLSSSPLDQAIPSFSSSSNIATTKDKKKDIERIKIIGSRIKQIHIEGPSPVIILNKTDMEKTGYNSISDVLRDLTVNSFGSLRETPGIGAPGASTIDLRGLGDTRTLVLIDGKRMQKDSLLNAVDLNMIPFAAVKRIEILKDSASAIYGSDALGGVVNIITRKDFNGNEVSAKYLMSQDPGGNQVAMSLTSGYSLSNFHITGILDHRSNQMIYARDRDHADLGLSRSGAPGTFRILKADKKPYQEKDDSVSSRSLYQPFPNCPEERKRTYPGVGTFCMYNYADHISMRPRLDQTSLMLNTSYQMKKNLKAFFRLSGTRRYVKWVYAPSPAGSSTGLGISGSKLRTYMEEANQEINLSQLQDDNFVDIVYRLVDLGSRITEVTSYQYSVLGGATTIVDIGRFPWEIEISGGYSTSSREDLGVSGHARKDELRDRLQGSFNPFAASGQRGDLQSLNYKTRATSETQFLLTEVSATGEIIEVPAGLITTAVGIQAHKEFFHVDADKETKNDNIVGNSGSALKADRSSVSGYLEFFVPLLQNIEWTLAGRQDVYSDFGQAFSPRTSLRWQIAPPVMLRSSIGLGFKAPDMDDLYEARSQGFPRFIDRTLCTQKGGHYCTPQQWHVTSGGNPSLKKERSLSASLGTFIQPTNKLSIGLDAWYIKLENQVGIDYEDVTKAEDKFGSDYVKEFGINIERDATTGEITSMKALNQNLSETQMSGLDVSTKLSFRTHIGLLVFGLQHSHLLYSSSIPFPGLEKENELGEYGHPRWRNTLFVTYAPTNNQSGSLTLRTIGKHEKLLKEKGTLDRYTEADLQYTYTGIWKGTLSVGIRNLLGTTPPIDDSNPDAPTIAHNLYDGNGRSGWIQYRLRF